MEQGTVQDANGVDPTLHAASKRQYQFDCADIGAGMRQNHCDCAEVDAGTHQNTLDGGGKILCLPDSLDEHRYNLSHIPQDRCIRDTDVLAPSSPPNNFKRAVVEASNSREYGWIQKLQIYAESASRRWNVSPSPNHGSKSPVADPVKYVSSR